eukprot:2224598-Amphidinium_carterae.1
MIYFIIYRIVWRSSRTLVAPHTAATRWKSTKTWTTTQSRKQRWLARAPRRRHLSGGPSPPQQVPRPPGQGILQPVSTAPWWQKTLRELGLLSSPDLSGGSGTACFGMSGGPELACCIVSGEPGIAVVPGHDTTSSSTACLQEDLSSSDKMRFPGLR